MSAVVECLSGYTYAERPVALTWQGERLEIAEVVAESRLPDGKRFRVRTADGQTFELTYAEAAGEWLIEQR